MCFKLVLSIIVGCLVLVLVLGFWQSKHQRLIKRFKTHMYLIVRAVIPCPTEEPAFFHTGWTGVGYEGKRGTTLGRNDFSKIETAAATTKTTATYQQQQRDCQRRRQSRQLTCLGTRPRKGRAVGLVLRTNTVVQAPSASRRTLMPQWGQTQL